MIKTECKDSCCNKENEYGPKGGCCSNEKLVNTDDFLGHCDSEPEGCCEELEDHSSKEDNCCSKESSLAKEDCCVHKNIISNNDFLKGQCDNYYSQKKQNKKQITK
ncbi:hypothetical protein ACFC8Y_15935 [Enterococcus casseliflavus]